MGAKAAQVRMLIYSRIKRSGAVRGYTLISVLLALVVLTTTLFAAQRIALTAATRLAIDEGLARQSEVLADLVAVGGAMNLGASPVKLEDRGIWIRIQSAAGLVDVNAAPAELVTAVFREVGISAADVQSRLEAHRVANNPDFRSLPDFFERLKLSGEEAKRIAPYVTVATGHPFVELDLAPAEMQSAIARAMTDLSIEPDGPSDRDIRLIMTARDIGEDFVPALYIERLADVRPRLLAYR